MNSKKKKFVVCFFSLSRRSIVLSCLANIFITCHCHRYRHRSGSTFSYASPRLLSTHWLKNIWHFSPSRLKHSSNLMSLHCLFFLRRTNERNANQMRAWIDACVFSCLDCFVNILHIFWMVWIYSIICHSFSALTILKH